MLGNSGAAIRKICDGVVEKTGGDTDLYQQARLCILLGPGVSPDVHSMRRDGYIMEELCHGFMGTRTATAIRVLQLLKSYVWCRPTHDVTNNWKTHLLVWSQNCAPWMDVAAVLPKLYGTSDFGKQVLTHGDPTLANVMFRADGTLVLIDPIPSRPGVPSLREVDAGKVLQSAMGWEDAKEKRPIRAFSFDVRYLGDTPLAVSRAFFWGAVHCARAYCRAKYTEDTEIMAWSHDASKALYERCRVDL